MTARPASFVVCLLVVVVVMSLPLVKSTSHDALGPKIHTPKQPTADDLPHPVKPTEQQSVPQPAARKGGAGGATAKRETGEADSDQPGHAMEVRGQWKDTVERLRPHSDSPSSRSSDPACRDFVADSRASCLLVVPCASVQAEPSLLGMGVQHQGRHVRRGPDPAQGSVSTNDPRSSALCAHGDVARSLTGISWSFCSELAAEITRDYAGRKILCVGLLSGCFVFLSDLLRHVLTPYEVDFMVVSSYGHGSESSGSVKLKKDMSIDPKGRDVLIIEDLIDTGNTLAWIIEHLKTKKCASVRLCTLLDKVSRRKAQVQIDYCGFECPDEVRSATQTHSKDERSSAAFICCAEF
jgi:hypoxanthine phosphoribosyltransferase